MHGDFSRWTFDPEQGYRSVLLQQGRVLLDADWNEQAEITARHDEVRTRDVVGRTGGPAALGDEGGAAGFTVVDSDGQRPEEVAWEDLRITSGRYYVDGLLCEAAPGPGPGWPLADQPHLPTVGGRPGLPEPEDEGRYAVYLEVRDHLVTSDEDSSLLEPALGGPDTTTRQRTLWQVRCAPIEDGERCTDLHADGWRQVPPVTMAAQLRVEPPGDDPCRLVTGGGYTRLENQLYRVQVHDPGVDGASPTFLWSRENGSVVARVTALSPTSTHAGMDAVVTLDREGRDDELSFRQGDRVELTSVDLQLRGEPGLLATAGAPLGLDLPLHWDAGGPASLQALGDTPLVRRWEDGPVPATSTATELEGGITVAFSSAGQARTGDFWLVPARAVRLAYGIALESGTLLWPQQAEGQGVALPPHGPRRHVAPLAVLERTGAGWTLESDCRRLFPPLTELVTLDLVGGDGQEAMPGQVLPEPVRVVVRNGGLPVGGAALRFTASDGGAVAASPPTVGDPSEVPLETHGGGVAEVRWLLAPTGPTTQHLRVSRLDDRGAEVGVALSVTGRLSVASEVAWETPCDGFAEATTVQEALDQVVTTRELRLLGGDGQHVPQRGRVVPQPVRVVLDSPCGPVEGTVIAQAGSDGRVVGAEDGEPAPTTLDRGRAGDAVEVATDGQGVAAFWWQPGFGDGDSAVLQIATSKDAPAPVRVTAQLLPVAARTEGLHVTALRFADGEDLLNDHTYSYERLTEGIDVELDGPVLQESVKDKPVVRVVLDLPWPVESDGELWAQEPVGYRSVELAAEVGADGPLLVWRPAERTRAWLLEQLPSVLARREWLRPVVARFVVDGWAVASADDPERHLNGHAQTEHHDGLTLLRLPTDDEVLGGAFTSWFRLEVEGRRPQTPVLVPDVVGQSLVAARNVLTRSGLTVGQVGGTNDLRGSVVGSSDPPAGTRVPAGTAVDLKMRVRTVNPNDPTGPVGPVGPLDPRRPTGPTDPTGPIGPIGPFDPR